MALASPSVVREARKAIIRLEWVHRQKMEAIRRANVAIFSKDRWMRLYAETKGEYQRQILRGLCRWDGKDIPESRSVKTSKGSSSVRQLRSKSLFVLLSKLQAKPGVCFLVGCKPAYGYMHVRYAVSEKARMRQQAEAFRDLPVDATEEDRDRTLHDFALAVRRKSTAGRLSKGADSTLGRPVHSLSSTSWRFPI